MYVIGVIVLSTRLGSTYVHNPYYHLLSEMKISKTCVYSEEREETRRGRKPVVETPIRKRRKRYLKKRRYFLGFDDFDDFDDL